MSPTLKAVAASAVIIVAIVVTFVLLSTRPEGPPPLSDDSEIVEGTGSGGETEIVEPGRPVTEVVTRDAVDVTVRIVDLSGRPLSRATLRVFLAADGDRLGKAAWDSGGRGNRTQAGTFALKLEPGAYIAHAQCLGHVGEKRAVTVVKGQPQELVFELGRGNSISGRVLDSSGAGVAGAAVVAMKEFAAPDADIETILMGLINLEEMTGQVYAETVSAADGSYQLDGLEDQWFTVRAAAPGFAPGQVRNVPAPREKVDVILPAGGVVTGTVTDASGRPVPDAEVHAFKETESQAMFDIILAKSRPPVDVAKAGAGEFEFRTLGTGVYNFRILAPGFRPQTAAKVSVSDGKHLPFTLEPGLVIAGYIQGPNGEPVVGARVRAQVTGAAARGRPEIDIITFGEGEVTSNAEGAFLFDTLESGEYNLTAFHQDYQTLRRKGVRPEGGELELRMSFGGRIRGLVTDGSGRPIAGARVVASDVADFNRTEVTDESGVFLLSGLQTGRRAVTVSVGAEGFARQRRDIKAPEGREVEAEFQLEQTATVSGLVVNSAGDPIRGVMLMVKKAKADAAVDYTIGNGYTDPLGRYEIPNIESGTELWIRAKISGFLEGASPSFSVSAGEAVELQPIVLDLGGTLAGRVVDPNGRPVAGAVVTIRREGQTEITMGVNPTQTSNQGGQFRLAGLASGTVDLVVTTADYLDGVVPALDVVEGQVVGPIEVKLELGAAVAGRVVDPDGAGVAGAEVLVRDYSRGAKEYRGVSDQTGAFRIGKIETEGEVEIEVTHNDYSGYLKEDVRVGDDLVIQLRELGRIAGVVVGPDGEPVTSFSVQPQAEGSGRSKSRLRARTINADDGRFEYAGVPGGTYTLQVRSPAFSAKTIPDVQVSEGEIADVGRVELHAGGIVSGQVVDAATREPIFGARVTIVQGASRFLRGAGPAPSGARRRPTETTDSNGEFQFTGLKGGSLTLRIKHADYVDTKLAANPDSDTESRGLVVELSRGGEITGVVLGADGAGRANMQVYLIGDGPSQNQRSRSDKEGRFKFRSVVPGNYTVKAHQFARGPDQPIQQAEIALEIGSGEIQDVVLQLP